EELAQRNEEPEVAAALEKYWAGRAGEARSRLKAFAARPVALDSAEEVRALRQEISAAEQLFKQGEGQIAAGSPEAAKGPFLKVLEHDRRLLDDLADRYPSYYRRKIQEDMARSSYARGRQWVERRNHRKACRAWKVGFDFYKGNADLNKAVATCSRRAADVLRKVRKCEQLHEVMDFAVDGDGLAGKIEQMRIKLQCRV
ncbi:MAG TPA: FHA domain-containing protein, partial [Myxococcaceae bacterium]|nr:FHA domain-containing protein [Myxococcaceae bacterium]